LVFSLLITDIELDTNMTSCIWIHKAEFYRTDTSGLIAHAYLLLWPPSVAAVIANSPAPVANRLSDGWANHMLLTWM